MARLARLVAAGLPHHITQRGTDRQRVFFTDTDRNVYLDLLATSAERARMRLLAYCLMPNHVHLIAVPEEATSLATALRRAHGRYANYLNARRNRSGHLWQNRFFSCALDTKHLFAALNYIERNPVRASLAARPEEFRWSSAKAHLSGQDPSGLLDLEFWREAGGSERWRGLLATPEELAVIRLLQRGTFSGRPVGDDAFVSQLESRLGRILKAHPRTP
jgi:putative transposase